ncbi:MAG: hypothetical protein OXT65_00650 [Alphaproteobacteria bacterium]|nr:hypothetical protein [Alphaproteobacteria bacterium]
MTDINLSNVVEQSAENLFHDYPQLRGNTLFIDATESQRSGTLKLIGPQDPGTPVSRCLDDPESLDHLKSFATTALRKGNSYASDDFAGIRVCVINADAYVRTLPQKDHAVAADFLVNHEAGHILIEHATASDKTNDELKEANADVFGVNRTLATHGLTSFHEKLPSIRSHEAIVAGETSHLTSQVVEKALEDFRNGKNLKDMDPQALLQDCRDISAQMATNSHEGAEIKSAFFDIRGYGPSVNDPSPLAALTFAATKDDVSNFAFLIGATAIKPYLTPEGKERGNGERIKLDDNMRQNLGNELATEAGRRGLDKLAAEIRENMGSICTPMKEQLQAEKPKPAVVAIPAMVLT